MADAAYRRELELELERLTKELADVRVEKAQQRQRIEQLQLEQSQLKDQLVSGGQKEKRNDLAQQLQSLHTVVKQKKQEHAQVKREWERSQEQFQQMKDTLGLLHENAGVAGKAGLLQTTEEEDMDTIPQGSTSREFLQGMWGSMSGDSKMDESESYAWEGDGDYSTVDGDSTVITEHTKDSLLVYRQKRAQRQQQTDAAAAQSGLGKFLSKNGGVEGTTTTALAAGVSRRGRLESHFEHDKSDSRSPRRRRGNSRDDEKDAHSAAE
mmetsp:Transcript_15191/g.25743  ORF Transcript_15191/g.25743 Transcript_15191/m.25743 type:complete len:267 (-) Transcript_15191:1069-1869(-)